MRGRIYACIATVCTVILVVSGCSADSPTPAAVSDLVGGNNAAGLPITQGQNGLRNPTSDPGVSVQGSDGGTTDRLAAATVADLQQTWQGWWPQMFPDQAPLPRTPTLLSYDSRDNFGKKFCGADTYRSYNAGYCFKTDEIAWDRGVLLPLLVNDGGPIAVVTVLAHEYGHRVQDFAGQATGDTPKLEYEQRSDCYAGAYVRRVASGQSPIVAADTVSGLRGALMSVFTSRDASAPRNDHGNGFERINAFRTGFGLGPAACTAITESTTTALRDVLPDSWQADGKVNTTPASSSDLRQALDSAAAYFALPAADRPRVRTSTDMPCGGRTLTAAAAYCPETNTVNVDVDKVSIAPPEDDSILAGMQGGGVGGYATAVSRYALAVLRHGGRDTTTPAAAASALCLTGAWARSTRNAGPYQLPAGTIDQVMSAMFLGGPIAADAQGTELPSVYSRVDAFQAGYLGTKESCMSRYYD